MWHFVLHAGNKNDLALSALALTFFTIFLVGYNTVFAATVYVAPTDDLQTLVKNNAAGTIFVLQPGVHHDSVTSIKSGDVFTSPNATTTDGVIEDGAKLLTNWTEVSINSSIYWTTPGGTPLWSSQSSAQCEPLYPGCYYSQNLYVDNVDYIHVTSLANVAQGKWYYDFSGADGGVANNVYLSATEDPGSHKIELSQYQHAFFARGGSASGITIKGLIIEKYGAPLQAGAIEVNTPGWLIQNNEVRLNHGYGVHAARGGDSIRVFHNSIHDNGMAGAGGPANGGTWSYNAIYHNNIDRVNQGFEAGDKWGGNGNVISYNIVHDNVDSPGLWSDAYATNTTFDHNTVYHNGGEGIRHEIGDTGTITNNILYDNNATVTGAEQSEIAYVNSSHGTITGNVIITTSRDHGIVVDYNNERTCSRDGACTIPVGMNISDNKIAITATDNSLDIAAYSANNGSTTSWQVAGMFDHNTYCVPELPWSKANWKLGTIGVGPHSVFSSWQSAGQDVHGMLTANASACTSTASAPPATVQMIGPLVTTQE